MDPGDSKPKAAGTRAVPDPLIKFPFFQTMKFVSSERMICLADKIPERWMCKDRKALV